MPYDLIIIGAGTAGLSAAIYSVRARLNTLVIEKALPGGQIINTPEIVNYPAIKSISGAEFANRLYEHACHLGARVVYETIEKIDGKADIKDIYTDQSHYQARGIIIANGARHRKIGCPGEDRLGGKGVSYCATCDGPFFKGKEICVVGGGNTALDEALYLSAFCQAVHLIHRRNEFRGNPHTVSLLREHKNIRFHLECEVAEIQGEESVTGVHLKSRKDHSLSRIPVSGVFIAIGLTPDNALFRPFLTLDRQGYIVAGEDCRTNLAGVYAAGDTRTKEVRQLVTAAADGAIAATHFIRDRDGR